MDTAMFKPAPQRLGSDEIIIVKLCISILDPEMAKFEKGLNWKQLCIRVLDPEMAKFENGLN
ncbi:hypothetical protein LguiA_018213 [Lonicera macranthoides]